MLVVAGLLATACGSSSSSSSAGATSTPSAGNAVASTSSSSSNGPYSSGASAVKVTTKHSKDGTILAAGPKELTVYMFAGDKGSKSNCTGACAVAWPPVVAKGSPTASGKASASDVGTAMRAGGVAQVTYKGHPLYYFIKDKDDGDAYGQAKHAFGADWYVLAPSGEKVDNS